MPSRTLSERLILGLLARGYRLDQAYHTRFGRHSKYSAYRQLQMEGRPSMGYIGQRYFVGKNGSLRVGSSYGNSHPSGLKEQILLEVPEHYTKPKPEACDLADLGL